MNATLANPVHGELPATKSYTRRAWQWLPADRDSIDRDGTLEIMLTTGRRVPTTEFHTYAVQVAWDECDVEAGVWVFLLENEREPDKLGPFACVVGAKPEVCGCEAHKYRLDCKHLSSLREIVKEVL